MGFIRAFLASLLVLCGAAWADDGGAPNMLYEDDIGSVVLLQTACSDEVAQLLQPGYAELFKAATYKNKASGTVMAACWVVPPSSGLVYLIYADTDTSALPQHLFQPVKNADAVKTGTGI